MRRRGSSEQLHYLYILKLFLFLSVAKYFNLKQANERHQGCGSATLSLQHGIALKILDFKTNNIMISYLFLNNQKIITVVTYKVRNYFVTNFRLCNIQKNQ